MTSCVVKYHWIKYSFNVIKISCIFCSTLKANKQFLSKFAYHIITQYTINVFDNWYVFLNFKSNKFLTLVTNTALNKYSIIQGIGNSPETYRKIIRYTGLPENPNFEIPRLFLTLPYTIFRIHWPTWIFLPGIKTTCIFNKTYERLTK